MPINRNTDLVISRYSRDNVPAQIAKLDTYLNEELQRIETAIRDLADASIQATDSPPPNPKRGMVRYNILPWNPLNNGYSGLLVYNGTAWVAV